MQGSPPFARRPGGTEGRAPLTGSARGLCSRAGRNAGSVDARRQTSQERAEPARPHRSRPRPRRSRQVAARMLAGAGRACCPGRGGGRPAASRRPLRRPARARQRMREFQREGRRDELRAGAGVSSALTGMERYVVTRPRARDRWAVRLRRPLAVTRIIDAAITGVRGHLEVPAPTKLRAADAIDRRACARTSSAA
jgi:hypothetical protein